MAKDNDNRVTSSSFQQPTDVGFTLPDWLTDYARAEHRLGTLQEKMAFVIGAAKQNVVHRTGGPFAAAIFEMDSGRLISLGVNMVTSQGLSILHGEMVAIALAQRKLDTYDLGRADLPPHALVTSSEPCAMCFGALPWSGIKRLVTGARAADAQAIGFDEGPKPDNWQAALQTRGIDVVTDIERTKAISVLRYYADHGGAIYNSREQDYQEGNIDN